MKSDIMLNPVLRVVLFKINLLHQFVPLVFVDCWMIAALVLILTLYNQHNLLNNIKRVNKILTSDVEAEDVANLEILRQE